MPVACLCGWKKKISKPTNLYTQTSNEKSSVAFSHLLIHISPSGKLLLGFWETAQREKKYVLIGRQE